MFRTITVTIALLLFLALPAQAGKTAILYGVVTDNGTPLAGTLVNITGEATYTSRAATTNKDGVYVFDTLPADEYLVRVIPQPEGVYKDGEANVFVSGGEEKKVDFTLKRK